MIEISKPLMQRLRRVKSVGLIAKCIFLGSEVDIHTQVPGTLDRHVNQLVGSGASM